MIGINNAEGMEPSIQDAFEKWDTLSERDLLDGLDRIEKYVELIEKEKHSETNKQYHFWKRDNLHRALL